MILFSDRLKLEKLYQQWLKDSSKELEGSIAGIKDCAINVVAFLASVGALTEDKVKELVKDVRI